MKSSDTTMLAALLDTFHSDADLGTKIDSMGGFFRSLGADQVYLCSTGDRRKLGSSEDRLTGDDWQRFAQLAAGNEHAAAFQYTAGGLEFDSLAVRDGERLFGWLVCHPAGVCASALGDMVRAELACCMRYHENAAALRVKMAQLETIRLLSEKASGFYNLNEMLNIFAEQVTKALNARGTVIRLVNREKNQLEMRAEHGLADVNIRRYGVEKGSGVSGEVWQMRTARLVRPDTDESRQLLGSKLGVSSLLCVPLVFENDVTGTISVYEKLSGGTFADEDRMFLEVIASLVSPITAYTSALDREKELHAKIEKNLDDMKLLTELNKVIMQPRRLDDLLFIILTALTFGEEIGFNRAALFMYNANTGNVQGMLGVGCESAEEAWGVWGRLPRDVTAVRWLDELVKLDHTVTTSFGDRIKKLRFHVNDCPPIAFAVRSGKVFKHGEPCEDLLCSEFGVSEYAIVPLVGKSDILGMLYVDNKFTGRAIDDRYIMLLENFATKAVQSIENAKLYSELKDTNDMLTTTRQELLMKEKLAIVGEMLTTLAHEIRNPLTAIGGFAGIMIKRLADPGLRELAEKIHHQATKMDGMFRDFLYLTRHSSFRYERADLNEIVKGCVENFSYSEKSAVTFVSDLADGLPAVSVDRNVFEAVLNNLIKNAIQAMSGSGHIYIRTFTGSHHVCLTVEDEGKGIPADVLPHIFDPFYTTKFDGVGIGLSISYKIIKQHSGMIYAENTKQRGARFVVKLPVPDKETAGGAS